MRSLQVLDLANRNIHIICLASPSEAVKPLFFRSGGPAVLHPSRSVPSFTYPKHGIRLPG